MILQSPPTWFAPATDNHTSDLANVSDTRVTIGNELVRARLVGLAEAARPAAALVLLDSLTPDRLEALARFWRGSHAPPAPPDPRITPQRRQRLRQMLRTVDARIERESYRAIATVLYPKHHIEAASWAGDALRETVIRLARDGMKLVRGGYRDLLKRPRKP